VTFSLLAAPRFDFNFGMAYSSLPNLMGRLNKKQSISILNLVRAVK